MARDSPSKALKILDLPTLGFPTKRYVKSVPDQPASFKRAEQIVVHRPDSSLQPA